MAGEETKSPFAPSPPAAPAADTPPKPPVAWQPFTPRGIANFAFATYNRLFWIHTLFALGSAAAVIWFLLANWTPVIRTAVRALPSEGMMREQRLHYPGSGPEVLAESRYLGIQVRRDEFSTTAAGADVRIEFYPHSVRMCSIFGCAARLYPAGWMAPFTRQELVPWWAAWEPVFLAIAGISVGLTLIVLWHVLPTLLCPFVRLIAYFADREVNMAASWRIASAALLPGIVVLIIATVLYGLGVIDLLRFVLAVPLAALVCLAFVIWAPFALRRIGTAPTKDANPFGPPK